MNTKTFVGLDVHRNLVVATAVNSLGKRIRQESFGSTPRELKKFLSRLPKPAKVVLEACAVWERYYEAAISTGAEVVVSHPRTTRMISEASLKTDKVDSATLAKLLRLDSIPLMYVPPPEIRALRKLYFERRYYVQMRLSVLRHAYSRLADHGVDYAKRDLRNKKGREHFRRHQIPDFERAADTLDFLDKRCKELGEQIRDAFHASQEAQLLATIPGIGEVMAVGLAGFLCPIERFPNVDKLTSYVGLCPTTHQSGDTAYHGKLKKDVNRALRSLVIAASWTNRVHAPSGELARYTDRRVYRKGKMRGTVAGAHKLVRIIYAILKQRRPFLPHAPESSAPVQGLRSPPRRIAARIRLRRASLGPPGRVGQRPTRVALAVGARALRQ